MELQLLISVLSGILHRNPPTLLPSVADSAFSSMLHEEESPENQQNRTALPAVRDACTRSRKPGEIWPHMTMVQAQRKAVAENRGNTSLKIAEICSTTPEAD